MAARWSTEHVVAEHRDLQANTMSVDSTGQYALLAGRKYLSIITLDKPTEVTKVVSRQSKWEVNTAEWNPHPSLEHLFAIACNQRAELITWRESHLTTLHTLRAHTRVIGDLNWSPFDCNLLATCSVDNYTYIWDIRDPRRPAISLFSIAGASQVKWNRVTGNVLATANEGDVRLWDHRISTSPHLYLAAHTKKILGLDWSPTQEFNFATASQECTVRFWDISNQRRIENIHTLNSACPVWRARYTPFGEGLVTVVVPQLRRGENSLFLWNIGNLMSPVHTFVGHTDVVLEFAWRKQREEGGDYQLVTWAKDHSLRIWRIDSQLQKLCGHDVDLMEASDQEGAAITDVAEPADPASPTSPSSPRDLQNDITLSVTPPTTPKTDSRVDSVSPLQPRTLQQEFSLVNINIPSVTVDEMDAVKRLCIVSAVNGKNAVKLHMNFPASYPVNAAPTFQFCKGTTIDNNVKTQLLKALKGTSLHHVKRNRSCLEPCLRQLKSSLDLCSAAEHDSENAGAYHLEAGPSPFLPPNNQYGSFQDVTVPFPRTSGASFCGAGYLVCFARPSHLKRMSNPGEVTPRSLSALVAYVSNTIHHPTPPNMMYSTPGQKSPSGETGVSVSSYYYQDRKHRGRLKSHKEGESHNTEQKMSKAGVVVVYNVSTLMPIHRELAQAYCLDTKNIPAMCTKNANAATLVGRKDLVQMWSMLAHVSNPVLSASSDPDAGLPWAQHPFGRQLLQSLMRHYIKIRDIQTVAMLCCAFVPINEKPTIAKKVSRCIADTVIYTPGGSPYHTIHPGDTNMDGWPLGVLLKTSRSNSWSDSLDEYAHDSRYGHSSALESKETDSQKHDCNTRFLYPKQNPQYDEFKRAYGEILYHWNLLQSRTNILKYVSSSSYEQNRGSIEFTIECQHCKKDVRGAHCVHCKNYTFQCAVCHIAVKGASNFCLICGHGGHAIHMLQWFTENDRCPVGCGCICLQQCDVFE